MSKNTTDSNSSTFWEDYYSKHRNPSNCSNFAEFVSPFLKKGKSLVDLGCGNGRDSIHFGEAGVNVLAIDQCSSELDHLSNKFENLETLNFQSGDMTNLEGIAPSDYLYSRFTIHAIDLEGEGRLLKWAYSNLNQNGLFLIEVRSTKDELFGQGEALADNAFFTDHYRRFLVLNEFEARLEAVGFKIIYSLESKGLAPYGDDDPIVIRVIAQKQ